jgi:hypothetical protein
MSLQRTCYFCGKPVSIRRHMSLFCSDRCETRHRYVSGAPAAADARGADGASPLPPPAPPGPRRARPRS